MSDKLSKEEIEALQANDGAVSLNSIAYNLHIRTPLARGCFYALNLCALAFLLVSGTGIMEGWLNQVNAPPEQGVTHLKIRTLLVFLLFLCVNLAMTFDRLFIESLVSALSIYLYAITTRFSQFYEYLTLEDVWPFAVFVLMRLIPLALLIALIREEQRRTAPDRDSLP
tara:strand:- start:1084 stop:1590 length:507 start_codon:yes stop_codon:yes gene_type:complete